MLATFALIAALSEDPVLPLPDSVTPIALVEAGGVQVYRCDAFLITTPTWTLDHPSASLYRDDGTPFGTHGAGPMWSAADGSTLYADGKMPVAKLEKPGGVPWLALRVTTQSGTGVLSGARYVERFDTLGGLPPAASECTRATLGALRAVHYSAKYEFFK